MIPSDLSDVNVYGGIYRYLNLVYNPSLSIDKLFVLAETDKMGKMGKLTVRSRFYNFSGQANTAVTIKLFDPKGKLVQASKDTIPLADNDVLLTALQVRSPQLWSTETPQLYTVEVSAADYKQTEKIGFRNFEFADSGPFLLNGKRLLLRGTHRHEDHAGVAAAMTEEMMRKEMIMMKEMGVNFIRLGHYQQSRIILNLCDSVGIVVWEEIPWCRGGIGGDRYKSRQEEC